MLGQIATVLGILPRIVAVVTLVENMLRPGMPGPEKKRRALEFLEASGVPAPLLVLAGPLIDLVVAVLNKTGVFHKPGAEPTVEAAELTAPVAAMRQARESEDIAITDDVFDAFVNGTRGATDTSAGSTGR